MRFITALSAVAAVAQAAYQGDIVQYWSDISFLKLDIL
jgi:hypothetical protein